MVPLPTPYPHPNPQQMGANYPSRNCNANSSQTIADRRFDSMERYWETIGWLSIGTAAKPLTPLSLPFWGTYPQSPNINMLIAAKPLQIGVWTQ